MINWQSVIFNSFWVVGLSIMLAAFSYHYWLAGHENRRLRLQLGEPGFLKPVWLGAIFICVGLAGTSEELWEMALWAVASLISLLFLVNLLR